MSFILSRPTDVNAAIHVDDRPSNVSSCRLGPRGGHRPRRFPPAGRRVHGGVQSRGPSPVASSLAMT
jgi:hypothetical protein